MIAYKQFRIDKSGNLHPLFVNTQEVIPVGEWITAKEGERNADGKVKSKLGSLAYRPGWHLSEAPYAPHIGIKENGKIKYMKPDTVWAMCKVKTDINYTPEAQANGWRNGKYSAQRAYLDRIPDDGFYWYTTNPNAFGRWLIAGKIMVCSVLTDEEVAFICRECFKIEPQPRKVG